MRILLSCYYFSPYRGGEAAVGWRYASGLAKSFDVTVLYGDLSAEEPMRKDLERYQAETGLPELLTAVHISADTIAHRIHDLHAKPGLFFLYYPAYSRWQQRAFETAERLHQEKPFDVVHHLTIIGYREPGYLWKLGIPFVWGPINGAAMMPWGFIPGFGWKGRYQHALRNVMNWIQIRLPSRSRKAAMCAAKIWAVTEEDHRMVDEIWGAQAELMIETGAEPAPNAMIRKCNSSEPLRLVCCGILEARKALNLILEAMSSLPKDVKCELHVIGEGAERGRWQQLAETLGIVEQVIWHGRVPHAEAQRLMARGHILIHSAVKEGTPHVVLEAMAQGMPVICHDACGMGVAVDENSGIKVPLHDPATSVAGFRNAILRLCNEPDLLSKLSQGALARATQLTWDNKVKQVADTYHKILSESP
jgi:glycosyltransferase involved in cell wall biosynthesis